MGFYNKRLIGSWEREVTVEISIAFLGPGAFPEQCVLCPRCTILGFESVSRHVQGWDPWELALGGASKWQTAGLLGHAGDFFWGGGREGVFVCSLSRGTKKKDRAGVISLGMQGGRL